MEAPAQEYLRRPKSFPQSKRELSSRDGAPPKSAASSIYELIIYHHPVLQPLVHTVTQPVVAVRTRPEENCVVEIEESDPQSDRIKVENSGLQRKKTAEFSITAVVASGMLLIAVFMGLQDLEGRVSQLHLSISVLLTISTLSSGIALFCFWRGRCAINLLFITCALMILTAASYLALLHKYYLLLLLPAYLILGAPFHLRIGTAHSVPTTAEYGSIKADLKKSLGLSSAAFSVSISGLLTFVIAFLKKASGADAHGKRVLDIVCATILFLECTVALMLVLLSCSPPKLQDRNDKASQRTSNTLKASSIVLWLILHFMATIVSYVLLGGGHVALLVALVPFFGVWVCFVVCSSMQRRNVQQTSAIDTAADCKLLLKFISISANVVAMCSFSGLLAVFAFRSYGGGGDSAVLLKIYVVALIYLFSFSMGIMLLLWEAPKNRIAHSNPATAEYRSIKADLKKSFGFYSAAFSVSFTGMITFAIALWKILSGADAHGKLVLDIVFAIILFLVCVFALELVLLSCSPPKLEDMNQRASLPTSRRLKILGFVLWLTLHSMAASMGCIVLYSGGHVAQLVVALVSIFGFSACCVVHLWSFAMRCHDEQQMSTTDGAAACKQHFKLIAGWANTMAIVSFGGLLVVFVSDDNDGGGDGAVLLKICVVALIYLFSFSFGIMMLLLEAPKKKSLIAVINILFYCSTFVLVLAAVSIGAWIMKIK